MYKDALKPLISLIDPSNLKSSLQNRQWWNCPLLWPTSNFHHWNPGLHCCTFQRLIPWQRMSLCWSLDCYNYLPMGFAMNIICIHDHQFWKEKCPHCKAISDQKLVVSQILTFMKQNSLSINAVITYSYWCPSVAAIQSLGSQQRIVGHLSHSCHACQIVTFIITLNDFSVLLMF